MEKSTPLSEIQQRKETMAPPQAAAAVASTTPPEIQEDEQAVNETLSQYRISQNKHPNPHMMPPDMTNMTPPSAMPMHRGGGNPYVADMTDEDYKSMMAMQNKNTEGFNGGKKNLLTMFCTESELERMLIVMVVFVVVSLLPVDYYLQKYVDYSRNPYAGILLKGVLAGILFMVIFSLL